MDTSLLDKAINYAVKAHCGAERKGHRSPYVLHVLEAASVCETMTNDIEVLSAAVLHDVVEDTDVTFEDVKREFGERVCEFVKNETEKCVDDFPADSWKRRKTSIITKLSKASVEAKMIALGDKLSNMRAIARDYLSKGDDLWSIFHAAGKEDVAWYYQSLAKVLSDLKEYPAYKEFARLINETFGDR